MTDILNRRCRELLSWAIQDLIDVRHNGSPWDNGNFNRASAINDLIDDARRFLTWTNPESTEEERRP